MTLCTDKLNVKLIPSVSYILDDNFNGKNAVVIDVLRATSVITTAVLNGASGIIPVSEIDEAVKLKDEITLLGGERKGLKIDGFDFGNSPLEYSKEKIADKKIVITTSNGTRAILKSKKADRILIASMLNGKRVAKELYDDNKDFVIVCAGTNGQFSLDDFITAGKIIYEVKGLCDRLNMDDFSTCAYLAYMEHRDDIQSYVKNAFHYNYLLSLNLYEDIKYCFKEDIANVLPEYRDGVIREY